MKLSGEKIESLIRQVYPRATIVSHRPLERATRGRDFAVQLQNPAEEVHLRIYPRSLPDRIIKKEMQMLRVVMPETGVPTPHVRYFDDSRTLIEWPYALLNPLPGEPLSWALPRMDELDQEGAGYELGRYLAKLHGVPLDRFGEFLGDDPFASPDEKSYVAARLGAWLEACRDAALLDEGAIAEIRRFVQVLDREAAGLVHGALGAEHVNVEEGVGGFHVTGLFGFGSAQGWSPEWDVALLAIRVFERHPALEKGFLDGYTDTGELPGDFWERLTVYRLLVNVRGLLDAHREGDEASADTRRRQLRDALKDLKR